MKLRTIEGGEPFRAIIWILLRHVGHARDRVRLADPISAAALRHRLPVFNHPGTGRDAIFGINAAGDDDGWHVRGSA